MLSPTLPAAPGKTLALILCGICMALPAIPAQAEVYRCKDKNGAVIYQEIACPSAGEAIRLQTSEPSAADQENANERARRERAFVNDVDAERENNRDLAQQDREEAKAKIAEQKARCAGYLTEAERLENIVEDRAEKIKANKYYDRHGKKHGDYDTNASARDLDRARNLRDQYFKECSKL